MINLQQLEESADKVMNLIEGSDPSVAMILGSGWGDVVDGFNVIESISYADIPCLGETGVKGHAGRLVLAECAGTKLLIFQGRRHWYEGCGWTPVASPVHLSALAGCNTLLITNAAGGIRSDLVPGTLMIIKDHINAMGSNPLLGPYQPVWGERFPDQSSVYDDNLQNALRDAASADGIEITDGVYLAASGPTYETPAEIGMYRAMGADAVGMSTVPEAMLGNARGMNVAGLSCITNHAAGLSESPLCHEEVIKETSRVQPLMKSLLVRFIETVNLLRQ